MAAILALDFGSTQLKLLVMNENAQVIYVGTQRYSTQSPRAGWVEQRPEDWHKALERGMKELHAKCKEECIDAISFSGHMSGVVLLDGEGNVLHPCIMLSDSRSEAECDELKEIVGDKIRINTGNPVINAFSLPKLLWLKKNEPNCWSRGKVWLSPKDYVRFYLTDEIATEYTDAYNSLCMDSETREWCDDIIANAGLEIDKFPIVLNPDSKAGVLTSKAANHLNLKQGTPVYAGGADMACGAVGMGLYTQGDSALTLGTSATFLAPVPKVDDASFSKVTFHLHAKLGLLYALGSHFNGGLAVNWLSKILSGREELDYSVIRELSDMAQKVPPGSEGLLTIPFLAGSGSPYFKASDRQTILGCSTATTKAHLFRSQLEGITINLAQTKQVIDQMLDGGLRSVLLGGGGCKIGVWPQIVADVFGCQIDMVSNADCSAIGAAILGGIGAGIFHDAEDTARRCLKIKKSLNFNKEAHGVYYQLSKRFIRTYKAISEYGKLSG